MEELEAFDKQALEKGKSLFNRPCNFMLSAVNFTQLPEPVFIEIAFAGRSNVGKSSLLNALFGQKNLAKTSATPGRTQQLNYFNLDDKLYIVDLPGYGYAKAPTAAVKEWHETNFAYLRGRVNLRRVFLMIDSRHGIKEIDKKIMSMLDTAAVNYQIILTKTDKVSHNELNQVTEQAKKIIAEHPAAHQRILATSSAKRIGLEYLRAEIAELLEQ